MNASLQVDLWWVDGLGSATERRRWDELLASAQSLVLSKLGRSALIAWVLMEFLGARLASDTPPRLQQFAFCFFHSYHIKCVFPNDIKDGLTDRWWRRIQWCRLTNVGWNIGELWRWYQEEAENWISTRGNEMELNTREHTSFFKCSYIWCWSNC